MADRPDLVLRGASILDGTGSPAVVGSVAVRGDRIIAVGEVPERGATEVDLDRFTLTPGFVDVHTHDDFAAVLHPGMGFKVLGGVTTCVVGNCGFGAAPGPAAVAMGRSFHPGADLPSWETYGAYLDAIDAAAPSVNIGALVGHGTVRLSVLGNDRREPTVAELDAMRAVVSEGLTAGALGMSTGLIYEPGRYATTDELVALAEVLAERGGLYTSHIRNEADRLVEAIDEAIEIGERAGVAVQISHHKAAGKANWGRVQESIARIDAARARGIDVAADQYPYTAGSTVLSAVLGGVGVGATAPDDVVIASAPDHPEWEGRSLAQLAGLLEVSADDVGARVLAAEPTATVVIHMMSEDDVQTVLAHPQTMIGSDGIPTLSGKPHPRLYGTFAKVLGHYSRDLGVLDLPDAVHRMTAMSARRFGLTDRGVIAEGAYADLVVFDAATIADVATYEDPQQPPVGIRAVWVNGREVVADGSHTGARAGRALRR